MNETLDGFVRLLAVIGPLSVLALMIVIGLISRRFGHATRAPRFFIGFFVAALLMAISVAAQIANLLFQFADAEALGHSIGWILVINGLPALAVTLGLYFAWRYWSWLLAERD